MLNISSDEFINGAKDHFQKKLEEGLNESEALHSTVDDLINQLSNTDLPPDFLTDCSNLIINNYKDALNEGHTVLEALDIAVERLYQDVEKHDNTPRISESNINLDFAITGESPRLELMNEAMAKGLSVQDAIKYVNSKLNENSNEFGPPTFAEFNKTNNDSSKTALQKENQEINKIEATMDAEANKQINDNTLSDKNIIDENDLQNESSLNSKDDEIS